MVLAVHGDIGEVMYEIEGVTGRGDVMGCGIIAVIDSGAVVAIGGIVAGVVVG